MDADCDDIMSARILFDEMSDRRVILWSSMIGGLMRCDEAQDVAMMTGKRTCRDTAVFETFPPFFSSAHHLFSFAKTKNPKKMREIEKESKMSSPPPLPLQTGAGYENRANVCYLNAVLQCFTHTVPFVERIRAIFPDHRILCHHQRDLQCFTHTVPFVERICAIFSSCQRQRGEMSFCSICALHRLIKKSYLGSVVSTDDFSKNVSEFPLELNLQPFHGGTRENKVKATEEMLYNLYVVVVHIGSCGSGHYISYVRLSPNRWCQFNDAKVSEVSKDEVLKKEAYIVFYTRESVSGAKLSADNTEADFEGPVWDTYPPSPKMSDSGQSSASSRNRLNVQDQSFGVTLEEEGRQECKTIRMSLIATWERKTGLNIDNIRCNRIPSTPRLAKIPQIHAGQWAVFSTVNVYDMFVSRR
ncbi:Ubiquitin carboxyl-terminal hydrolase 8 [Acorus gramineus]|uniref:Ubiquitin carboxyl-terminal hydrolase 8 n=1 Tax=Acorus gramineus TaxID=55184 RepID=A0AAV9BBX2_ACOGR|nr:Ubiquitin carboxyl-terminal hydrolase 8 [Acorus gramineus]